MLPLPPFCPLFPHTSPCVLVRSFCLSLRNSVFSSLPARLVQAAPRYLPAARAQGGSGQGPVVGPTGISCSHGLGAPLTYDVPNTRLQGVLLLIGIIDFFFFSPSFFLYSLTHFTGPACLLALFPSSLSLPHFILESHGKPVARGRRRRPLSNFRIPRETSFALCAVKNLKVRKEFTYIQISMMIYINLFIN